MARGWAGIRIIFAQNLSLHNRRLGENSVRWDVCTIDSRDAPSGDRLMPENGGIFGSAWECPYSKEYVSQKTNIDDEGPMTYARVLCELTVFLCDCSHSIQLADTGIQGSRVGRITQWLMEELEGAARLWPRKAPGGGGDDSASTRWSLGELRGRRLAEC